MPGDQLDTRERLTVTERAEVAALLAAAAAADQHPPVDDQQRIELTDGPVTPGGEATAGPTILARRTGPKLAGLAHLSHRNGDWELGVVVHPNARAHAAAGPGAGDRSEPLRTRLLGSAFGEVARRGGGNLTYWEPRSPGRDDPVLAGLGLTPGRALLQLRRPLPLDDAARAGTTPVATRPFRPGHDEADWLAVNNRAFARHPEQGGWDLETLRARASEPWFDPAGFLLHEEGGRLIGSCWTKIHRDGEPPIGEIYVISVDPAHQGRGLGRSLAVAGLDWLAAAGLRVGMLYVDQANEPALGLYRRLGFNVDHVDRAWTALVLPRSGADFSGR